MKRFIFTLFCSLLPLSLYAAQIQGKVVRVLDGDTIEVLQENRPVRIRLANIDAPEKGQRFGRWATSQLKALVAGQPVIVTYTRRDRYNRIVGHVVTITGIEASHYQVSTGAAWVYDRYNEDKSLPAMQQMAREHKYGLWSDSKPVSPWIWRNEHY